MRLLLSINKFKTINYSGDVTFYSYIKVENGKRVKGFKPSFSFPYPKEIQLIIASDNTHTINVIDENDEVNSYSVSDMLSYMTGEHLEITYDTIDTRTDEMYLTLLSSNTYVMYSDTELYLYTLNCERNKVSKREGIDIIRRDAITGKFKDIVSVRNPIIDIEGVFDLIGTFNYVYILGLERYYFVESVDLVSKNITRLSLVEDVLTSHDDLIRQQQAFVSRSAEFGDDTTIIDNRFPLESVKTVRYITPTHTSVSSNVENISLNLDIDSGSTSQDYYFAVSIIQEGANPLTPTDVTPPTGSGLPTISATNSPKSALYFLTYWKLNEYLSALMNQDNYASYLNSIILYPFNPLNVFTHGVGGPMFVGNNKVLALDADLNPYITDYSAGLNLVNVYTAKEKTSPYLILADIEFPNCTKWYEKEPYTIYEIYIPFVGWVKLDTEQCNNSRLLVYYNIDFTTGNGTAYIYNRSTKQMIYSTSCQIGVKFTALITNAQELARERQSLELNTLIGLVASAVSIGAGIVSENPVAIAGGAISAGKTISSAVNRERMMFERAQVTYGSGDSAFHSPLTVKYRKTYYKPIITDVPSLVIYKEINGLPCNKYMSLSNCGNMYLEIGEIHFDTKQKDIYNDEVNEIVKLLQEGVIL